LKPNKYHHHPDYYAFCVNLPVRRSLPGELETVVGKPGLLPPGGMVTLYSHA
jgi:hypothetical protein